MPQNFIECGRDQAFLLPPSLLEWLPEGHLAWTILDAVAELDLSAFYGAYRADGHGRPAYEPSMMVALLLYAYARGNRSSRGIERECVEDVAYRVICANLVPDHSTIAEFRKRHETALADLFTGVLALCGKAGLVKVGVIAVDGTKVHASSSHHNNLDYGRLVRAILAEADRVDREEDELYGDARGDELPEQLQTVEGRRAALKEAKRQLESEREANDAVEPDGEQAAEGSLREVLEFDAAAIVTRDSGREGWLREGKRQLDAHRERQARPVPRSRSDRLLESERRMSDELGAERVANEAYETYRAQGRMKDGRRFGGPPKPYEPPDEPAGVVNTTDPDSHNMQTARGWVQGYNAQAAVNEEQIVVAAEVMVRSPDFGNLGPVVAATETELAKAGVTETPGVVIADAGYLHQRQIEAIVSRGIQVIVPPDADRRKNKATRPGNDGFNAFMRQVLATDLGGGLYRKRQGMIEPVFGDIKFNRRIDRFQRRGRSAARSEWRLITATNNLLKLHKHLTAATAV
jgi:transposase